MKSMTGFGKASYSDEYFEVEVEVKSLNHRFLDVRIILPREIQSLEMALRDDIAASIRRGKVDVRVTWKDKRIPRMGIDRERLLALWRLFNEAREVVGQQQEISLDRLLEHPGIISEELESTGDDALLDAIQKPLKQALVAHAAMADKEGEAMQEFFISSLTRMDSALAGIEAEFPEYRTELFNKYKTQATDLLQSTLTEDDTRRLLMETALFVDKADINEEIIRLRDHIVKFRDRLFDENGDVGKSLNFILQEMQREANTIGSKFNSVKVFGQVLTIKEEIEKCRELVQNVE